MIYKFKQGMRYRKECDPQQIGEQLESIRVTNDGRLQVEDVLREAANPASPLHPAFTWNNDEAADSWRRSEARQLIRAVVVTKTEDSDEEMNAFWSVRLTSEEGDGEQFYQSLSVLEESPRQYHAALTVLLGQIDAVDRSLKELRKVSPRSQMRQVDQAEGFINKARNILNI